MSGETVDKLINALQEAKEHCVEGRAPVVVLPLLEFNKDPYFPAKIVDVKYTDKVYIYIDYE